MYATRDVPLGMLVPASAENGQEEGQARQQQQQGQPPQQQQSGSASGGEGSTPAEERQQSAAVAAAVQVSANRVLHDMLESKLPEVRAPGMCGALHVACMTWVSWFGWGAFGQCAACSLSLGSPLRPSCLPCAERGRGRGSPLVCAVGGECQARCRCAQQRPCSQRQQARQAWRQQQQQLSATHHGC